MPSAVVLVIDRLNPGFLGPYGNTWVETPAFNRLACQSLLVEHALTDSPDLARVYRSYWTGRPAWTAGADTWSLPRSIAAAGVKAALITDEPQLVDHPLAADFDEIIALPEPMAERHDDPQDSAVAQTLQDAAVWLERASGPFLLWVHLKGMSGPWDASYELRQRLADEEDPPPPDWILPPAHRLSKNADPDIALGYTQAYGAQTLILDACLGAFLAAIEEIPNARDALLAVTSPRGFPLGEHGRLGPIDDSLYAEAVQTPLFLKRPDGAGALVRSQSFAQPFDLCSAVAEWGGWSAAGATPSHLNAQMLNAATSPRELAFVVGNRERAVRTPAWFLRESPGEEPARELFVKPDDRWEMNEVAGRCAAECDALAAITEKLPQFADPAAFPPLEAALREARR